MVVTFFATFLISAVYGQVHAQTRTWTANSARNFLTGSNWSGGVVPNGINHTAVISTKPTTGNQFSLNGPMTLGTLSYSNTSCCVGHTIHATGTLTMRRSSGNALIDHSGSGKLTFNFWNGGGGQMVLHSTTEFRIDSGHGITAGNTISGSGGLIKTGTGPLNLNGSNSYSGQNTFTSGLVNGNSLTNQGVNSAFGRGNFTLNGGRLNYTGGTTSSNRTFSLGSSGGQIQVASVATELNLTGQISGSGTLTKFGSGKLILSANNTFSGGTTIYSGDLQIGNGGTTGTAGSGDIVNNGTLIFNRSNINSFDGIISGSGSVVQNGLGSGGQLILSDANSYDGLTTINSGSINLSGSATLGSTAAGTIVNDGGWLGILTSSTVHEDVSITGAGPGGGALVLIDGANLAGNLTLSGNATVGISNSGSSAEISGAISESTPNTSFTLNGFSDTTRNLHFTGSTANTYTGLTTIHSGYLALNKTPGVNAIAGDGLSASIDLQVENNAALQHLASHQIADSATLNLNGTNSQWALAGQTETLGAIQGSGNIDLGNGQLTTGSNGEQTTFTGVIQGSGSIVKTGTGTFTLEGTNLYTGQTDIQQGEIQLLGGTASISESTQVDIQNGATLRRTGGDFVFDEVLNIHPGGNLIVASGNAFQNSGIIDNKGTIYADEFHLTGTLTGGGILVGGMLSDGILSPGNSPGEMEIDGNLELAGGSYLFEINDASGSAGDTTGWDLISVSGSTLITASVGDPILLDVTSLTGLSPGEAANFDSTQDYTWNLLESAGGITGFDPSLFTLNLSGFQNALDSGSFELLQDGNSIALQFNAFVAPVPEPGTGMLLLLGVVVCRIRRRP